MRLLPRVAFLCTFLTCCLFASAQTSPHPKTSSAAAANAISNLATSNLHPNATIMQVPLAIEPNVGQGTPGAIYLAHSGSLQVGFFANHVDVQAPGSSGREKLGMLLVDARRDATMVATEKGAGESNYLLGNAPSGWHTHIPQYGRITYERVYPGVDLTFYGRGQQVEHDFVVQPRADYRQVRVRYEGADRLYLSHNGDLHVVMDGGELLMRAPHIYQPATGRKIERNGSFVLLSKNEVGFHIDAVAPDLPLIIDPVLDYSTYLADLPLAVSGVAVDGSGNTYIVGSTFSSNYPVTAGSFQTKCASCAANKPDVFITKLNATGTAQVYSTLLGGSDYDEARAIAVDASGDAIIAGRTSSKDFPLKNPISAGVVSSDDGFVTSLAPDGASLNFSSRLGGTDNAGHSPVTFPGAVAVDSNSGVYVSGTTQSQYLPVTPGALHSAYVSSGVFLTKLQPTGRLAYSAIVGDSGDATGGTGPSGLAVDLSGNAYLAGTVGITGFTNTTPWPTTPGAYQAALISPSRDAPFVTKISPDGASILYSTLVGTGHANSMALTSNREVILVGAGINYPITPDAFDSAVGAGFIAKLSADASQLLYSSYFGTKGSYGGPGIQSVALDTSGNVWIAGYDLSSPPLPVVHPLQSLPGPVLSNSSAFVSEFDSGIHTLLFSTYFNGAQAGSQISGVALDVQGRAHIAGTGASDMPTTSSAFQRTVTPPPPGYSYTYGFAALIDPAQPGPGICFSPNVFTIAQVGSSSSAPLTVTNCGTVPLTIDSVQLSSPIFALPPGSNCVGTLSENASCTISVIFTPPAAGDFNTSLTLTSSALIPTYSLPVSGSATTTPGVGGATATLSPKTLAFGTQRVGAASAPQQLTLTNTGGPTLSSLAVAISGADAASFSQTNNCGKSVASGKSCTINVIFTPSSADAKQASLLLTDSAANSPQSAALSGSGAAAPGIAIAFPAGASSATVQSGQPANYTLALSSTGGLSGPVTLSCSKLPPYATCSFSPSTINVSSGSASSVSLTISTQQKSQSVAKLVRTSGALVGLVAILFFPGTIKRKQQAFANFRRTHGLPLFFMTAAVIGTLTFAGCGGSAPTPAQPGNSSTPAGTYTISVVATSGTTSQASSVSLVVQ